MLPKSADLSKALRQVGLEAGDMVYLSTQLYGIGPIAGLRTRDEYVSAVLSAFQNVIGERGTLVVPTFTQQVGRYGLSFELEQTISLTGIFGEYVRQMPSSVRSLHPIFSVSALGYLAKELCADISPVAFGADSIFDRMTKRNAKVVCMGFDYYSGHIVSLMHHVETMFAVPYYYNKLVTSRVFAKGNEVKQPFVINVKYLDLGCSFDYHRYIDALAANGCIRSAAFGRGEIHSVDASAMFDVGIALLKSDPYAFLAQLPHYEAGRIPCDGPPERLSDDELQANWQGFYIGV